MDDWGTALNAIESALQLEKTVNQSLLDLHKVASEANDPNVSTFFHFLLIKSKLMLIIIFLFNRCVTLLKTLTCKNKSKVSRSCLTLSLNWNALVLVWENTFSIAKLSRATKSKLVRFKSSLYFFQITTIVWNFLASKAISINCL